MPRKSKKNQSLPTASSASVKTKTQPPSNSSSHDSGKAPNKKVVDPIDQLFYSYANHSSGIIDPEGIEALCSDLKVDCTDVRILMLAWKLQSKNQGYFTLEEWQRGLKALRADSIIKLRKALPELEEEVKKPTNHVEFYSFAFQYCLTEEKQKSVDIDSVCQLLELVLGSQFRVHVDSLVEYLRTQTDYKVITMDQWMGFHRFCNGISFPDLSNFNDQEDCWPLILDNFVDWVKERSKQ